MCDIHIAYISIFHIVSNSNCYKSYILYVIMNCFIKLYVENLLNNNYSIVLCTYILQCRWTHI